MAASKQQQFAFMAHGQHNDGHFIQLRSVAFTNYLRRCGILRKILTLNGRKCDRINEGLVVRRGTFVVSEISLCLLYSPRSSISLKATGLDRMTGGVTFLAFINGHQPYLSRLNDTQNVVARTYVNQNVLETIPGSRLTYAIITQHVIEGIGGPYVRIFKEQFGRQNRAFFAPETPPYSRPITSVLLGEPTSLFSNEYLCWMWPFRGDDAKLYSTETSRVLPTFNRRPPIPCHNSFCSFRVATGQLQSFRAQPLSYYLPPFFNSSRVPSSTGGTGSSDRN